MIILDLETFCCKIVLSICFNNYALIKIGSITEWGITQESVSFQIIQTQVININIYIFVVIIFDILFLFSPKKSDKHDKHDKHRSSNHSSSSSKKRSREESAERNDRGSKKSKYV